MILIKNIKELIGIKQKPISKILGKDMSILNTLKDAFIFIENGKISDFGCMSESKHIYILKNNKEIKQIDAAGKMVFPCFCDSHTHIVYAGSREFDFIDKIKGLSYEEIAKRGGGILNSAKKLQGCTEQELVEQALLRLDEMKSFGTGAVEIKSGYGLSLESELKILRVIKKLKKLSPLTIKSTFLGAHAIPAKFKNAPEKYIDLIINKMLPVIAEEKLADYIDVFCDKGFFSVKDTERILSAGQKYNLTPKIHANELGYTGGVQVGVKHKALSVDHLEYTGEEEIKCLLKSETMPTLLPGTSFFLGLPYAPARKMIDAGLPVALASDFNPGSSPSENMQFVISLGCIKYKMTPEEAINAATINSAYAMGVEKELGGIAVGKKANIFITKPIPSYQYFPYSFGSNKVEMVILNGKIQ
ncbi:MAG: imidazolonepropionase [Bacteroidales bacterium]|jgi:imidazolonepropionase